MATNGNTIEQAKADNRALTQMLREVHDAAPPITALSSSLMAIVAQFSEECRNKVDALVAEAEADRKEAHEFSGHIAELFRNWAGGMLARKRAELAELEKFLGKISK